ncbi:unnamed protein product [Amoebophrya sp. A120]|nr:unnamed protein product [Amoebophrya sp. A120]|eukprot:GSA120T00013645001.1
MTLPRGKFSFAAAAGAAVVLNYSGMQQLLPVGALSLNPKTTGADSAPVGDVEIPYRISITDHRTGSTWTYRPKFLYETDPPKIASVGDLEKWLRTTAHSTAGAALNDPPLGPGQYAAFIGTTEPVPQSQIPANRKYVEEGNSYIPSWETSLRLYVREGNTNNPDLKKEEEELYLRQEEARLRSEATEKERQREAEEKAEEQARLQREAEEKAKEQARLQREAEEKERQLQIFCGGGAAGRRTTTTILLVALLRVSGRGLLLENLLEVDFAPMDLTQADSLLDSVPDLQA